MKKKILTALVAIFVIIQFFPAKKNQSNNEQFAISKQYTVPDSVAYLLKVACSDCHSNYTEYPWYSKVQPIGWWLAHHVEDGKRELNFSNFIRLPIAVQNKKFKIIIELVEKKAMPLPSFTYFGLHKEANLTTEQRNMIIHWAKAQMDSLSAKYPADSLVLKRKPSAAK